MKPALRHIVAIDGPAGSGKSTVARGVARVLGLEVLDTGAMYRAVTLLALERGLDLDDGAAVASAAGDAVLELGAEEGRVALDGRDVATEIRGPAVSAAVSQVSAHPAVRALLIERQREWVEVHGGGVVEGRDIGTVVFPDAPLKVFLVATAPERAERRARDEEAADRPIDAREVEQAISRRDELDSSRAASPLRPAGDAVVIDTTGRAPGDVINEVVDRFRAVVGAER